MSEAGLWNIARDTPDAVAVVDVHGGQLTYGELAARADRVMHLNDGVLVGE